MVFNATTYKQAMRSSELKMRPTTATVSRFSKTSVFQSTDFTKDRKLPAQISKNGLSAAIKRHDDAQRVQKALRNGVFNAMK